MWSFLIFSGDHVLLVFVCLYLVCVSEYNVLIVKKKKTQIHIRRHKFKFGEYFYWLWMQALYSDIFLQSTLVKINGMTPVCIFSYPLYVPCTVIVH